MTKLSTTLLPAILCVLFSLGWRALPACAEEPPQVREVYAEQVWDPLGTIESQNRSPYRLILIPGDRLLEQGFPDDQRVYDLHGKLLWRFDLPEESAVYSCAAPDGTIYVGTRKNNVYAIAPDYTVKWKFHAQGARDWVTFPQVGPDGNVYVTVRGGYLYAISPDGEQLWSAQPGISSSHPPTISRVGVIAGIGDGAAVVALDMQGRELWRSAPNMGLQLWLIPSEPEVLVCGWGKENRLTGFSMEGEVLWRHEGMDFASLNDEYITGDKFYLPIQTATIEQLKAGEVDDLGCEWIAVDSAGQISWRYPAMHDFVRACTLPDGRTVIADAFLPAHPVWNWITNAVIWLGGGTAMLVVLDQSGAVESKTFLPFILPQANPVALPDGTVLVVGNDGKLYCYEVP